MAMVKTMSSDQPLSDNSKPNNAASDIEVSETVAQDATAAAADQVVSVTPATDASVSTGSVSIESVSIDPWQHLTSFTRARIALGRAGTSMPTSEVLNFGYAHALARDAVHRALDVESLCKAIHATGLETLCVDSAAPDRATYLLRPDLGRQLDDVSVAKLENAAQKGFDVVFVVGDGLSSLAVTNNVPPYLSAMLKLMPGDWQIGPVVVANQARVALGDGVGVALKAVMVVMLIGERPGLSSPDSLGVYITYQPRNGLQDSERNCISNVRPQGLDYPAAAHKAVWLMKEAMRMKLSGVGLKDLSDVLEITGSGQLQIGNNN